MDVVIYKTFTEHGTRGRDGHSASGVGSRARGGMPGKASVHGALAPGTWARLNDTNEVSLAGGKSHPDGSRNLLGKVAKPELAE